MRYLKAKKQADTSVLRKPAGFLVFMMEYPPGFVVENTDFTGSRDGYDIVQARNNCVCPIYLVMVASTLWLESPDFLIRKWFSFSIFPDLSGLERPPP
jgi:hypothetical protein